MPGRQRDAESVCHQAAPLQGVKIRLAIRERDQLSVQEAVLLCAPVHMGKLRIQRRDILVPLVAQHRFALPEIGDAADAVQFKLVNIIRVVEGLLFLTQKHGRNFLFFE